MKMTPPPQREGGAGVVGGMAKERQPPLTPPYQGGESSSCQALWRTIKPFLLSYCETWKLNSASGPILLPAGGDCVTMTPRGPLPAGTEVTPPTLKPAFSRL